MYKYMFKSKFLDQKDQIINWFNEGKQYTEIARLLNSNNIQKDANCIRRLVRNFLGDVKGHRKIVITEEIASKIHQLLDQGYNTSKISETLNINPVTINSYLRLHGIRLLPSQGNIHYFDTIDSYAKAYIVGFIAADGALVKYKNTTTLTITIKYEDKAVLEFIKSEIGNKHNLREIIRPSSYNKDKNIHHIRLAMSNNNITKALNNLGITCNKSLSMENIIRNIPYEFRDAFIIGYFDGDGSVSINNKLTRHRNGKFYPSHSLFISIRGTKEFLSGICDHLNISKSYIRQHDSIPRLNFASKKDTYRFFQCYNNLPFYYERKYNKFLQRINHPSYDKYKQVQTISSSID